MALRNSEPKVWSPLGATDTLDSTNTPTGAMAALQNLIKDPTTLGLYVCRPASQLITNFGSFNTPGFISWCHVVGNQVYGLIKSNRNVGFDEPFCFDLSLNAFVAVSGITGANVPTSPASTGAWTPPTSAIVGTLLIVTHPGFPGGAGNYFGWFDISNSASPVWHAGNTATNALPFAPRAVYQFYNRAYFACNQFLVYSDVLAATTVTSATQALTLGDNQPITALGGLPANNLVGAVTQALIAFKSTSSPMQMYQITGDAALSSLAANGLTTATGTLSPMSVCSTPKGLGFLAPDGLRFVDYAVHVTDPVNTDGQGVSIPFTFAVEPSRVQAACNGNILRVSTQNGAASGSPQQEWWFDFKLNQWTGPHTFPSSVCRPYKNTFIIAPQSVQAALFQSDVQQTATSVFVENGVQMSWLYQTPMLPDANSMAELSMVETTVDIAYPANTNTILALAADQNGTVFDSVQLQPAGVPTNWGGFNWGQAVWGGALNALYPRRLAWHFPIVFRRMYLALTGSCSAQFKIGTARMRLETLGYIQQGG